MKQNHHTNNITFIDYLTFVVIVDKSIMFATFTLDVTSIC